MIQSYIFVALKAAPSAHKGHEFRHSCFFLQANNLFSNTHNFISMSPQRRNDIVMTLCISSDSYDKCMRADKTLLSDS